MAAGDCQSRLVDQRLNHGGNVDHSLDVLVLVIVIF